MALPSLDALQLGLPDVLLGLVGIAGMVVLLMILVALGGFAYKSYTGGIEWPDEKEEDEDELRTGDSDDEWEYY